MKTQRLIPLAAIICMLLSFSQTVFSQNNIQSPESYFGFKPGDDKMLFNYESLISYLEILDIASDKMEMRQIGQSPYGKPMYVAFISSSENIAKLNRLKKINKELALNPNLSEKERESLIEEGKVFVYATLSMHSTEVGPALAAPAIAYHLLSSTDKTVIHSLNNTVFMMVPNHNPDGMNMIVDHYNKYKGTKYEGSSLPRVYHKYVGHDNNRDFVTLSQKDTKAIAAVYNTEWYPQVMVEKHQMGSSGVRYFVPPPHDPIAENIDASLWTWIGIFGSNMMKDMTNHGLKGVAQNYLFDDYWPGSTETCIWKNVIGMLTECASVKIATPIYIEPNELRVGGKGLAEYKKSIRMPDPWEGGWWKLCDIVEYEFVSTMSILKTASLHRYDILKFRNDLCKKEIEKGRNLAPFYYIFSDNQHDKGEYIQLMHLLDEHGVEVFNLNEDIQINKKIYKKGSIVIPLAQPIRAFIKEVLEAQVFPLRHYTPNGDIIRPYDIASWSLPLHRGIIADEINTKIDLMSKLIKIDKNHAKQNNLLPDYGGLLFSANNNESYKAVFNALAKNISVSRLINDFNFEGDIYPKGSFLIIPNSKNKKNFNEFITNLNIKPAYLIVSDFPEINTVYSPRVALVETNTHDMDAGWTRYIFDQYKLNYKVLKPDEFVKVGLSKNFDVIIFPNTNKSILMEGKYKSDGTYYPSRYTPDMAKGMGSKGKKELLTFIENGGIVLSWGRSTELFLGVLQIEKTKDEKESFSLPIRNIASVMKKAGVYCPGSLVKMKLKNDHPLTYGMPAETGIFFRGDPVFSTSQPGFDTDRRVIGVLPEKDILISGYLEKEEKLANKSVMVWTRKGKGQVVFYGFNPQFRASTMGVYKLLFNGILLEKLQ